MNQLRTIQAELHALLEETAQEIHNARIGSETFQQEMQAFAAEAQELDLQSQGFLEECERELEAFRSLEVGLRERTERIGIGIGRCGERIRESVKGGQRNGGGGVGDRDMERVEGGEGVEDEKGIEDEERAEDTEEVEDKEGVENEERDEDYLWML